MDCWYRLSYQIFISPISSAEDLFYQIFSSKVKQRRHYTLTRIDIWYNCMMTSSNGNIFRVTCLLCGEFTCPGEFPAKRPVTWSFDDFFDLRPNKRLSKQPWGWWFETPSWSLWRQCNGVRVLGGITLPHILEISKANYHVDGLS